jgi:hypothetical protein
MSDNDLLDRPPSGPLGLFPEIDGTRNVLCTLVGVPGAAMATRRTRG